MYIPPHFALTDTDQIAQLVADAPLACLIAQTDHGMTANHLPLLMAPDGHLIGHIARANDLHRLLPDGAPVLAVFTAAQGYITPNDYPSKAETHRQVPTWNYTVAHLHGMICFQHDLGARRAAVGLLTRQMERARNGDQGWRMADAPQEYMAEMLEGIVALRIDVTRIEAKAKLSQNKDARDIEGAIAGLRAQGRDGLADDMAGRRG